MMATPARPDVGESQPYINTAVVPALRPDYTAEQLAAWLQRHEEFVSLARRGGLDVAFFGDSLTDGWRTHGHIVWEGCFAPLRAGNFGLAGDRTQQLLWRLTHGGLDGLDCRAAVVLIGTNNTDPGLGDNSLTPRNTPLEIVAGVTAVVQTLRMRLPGARVLLLGVFPRGPANAPVRGAIATINAGLRQLDDGGRFVSFLDIGARFLNTDGSLRQDLMPDQLHLNTAGYEVWADAIRAPLASLLA